MKIAILGAGLMGRTLALHLYHEGITNLTLIDKDNINSSLSPAMIAAGMLACLSESVAGGRMIYELGSKSIALWRQYLTWLNALHLLNDKGTLLIADAQFEAEIGHFLAKINFYSGCTGFYDLLDNAALHKLEPELNFNQAYYVVAEGAVVGPQIMQELAQYLGKKVLWLANTRVDEVNSNATLWLNGKSQKFDWVIDCRGIGATDIYPQLRGVRGEIIRVFAPEVHLSRPIRLFHPRYSVYIVPGLNNQYVIGATEVEASDYSPVSLRSALELLGYAYKVHSGFAEARIISLDSNCRPALADNLPAVKTNGQMIAINGLYRHGFLLVPALAEEIALYLKHGRCSYKSIWNFDQRLVKEG